MKRSRLRALDETAAAESLARLLRGERVFVAVALYRLVCGHVRPMNAALELGDELECLACSAETPIGGMDLIRPTLFPSPAGA